MNRATGVRVLQHLSTLAPLGVSEALSAAYVFQTGAPMLDRDDPRRWEFAVENTRLGLWDCDLVTGETVFNERWAKMIGHELSELEPTTVDTWRRFAHPEDLQRSDAAIAKHIAGESDFYDVNVRMQHKSGRWLWVHARGQVVERAADGTPTRMVGTHEDVTERIEREIALQEAKSVFENSLEGILILDADEVITSVNPAFTAITGWSSEAVVGTSLDDIRTHADDPAESERLRTLARSESGLRVERDFLRSDGTYIPMLMSINRVLDPGGRLTGFVAQLSDIGERVRAEESRLERLLRYDQSTGLPNRRYLIDQIDSELRSLRNRNRTSTLILISLDEFGSMSDAFGHEAAELTVAIVAGRLREALTAGDILARYSRSEFGALVGGILSRDEAEAQARGLLAVLDDVCHVPGAGDVFITASAGIALLPEGIESAEDALQFAESALRLAQASGPGSVRHHEEGFVAESRERVVRAAQIRQAWLDSEFELDYQPIHDVNDFSLVGAEALMRWRSPILGNVPPAYFIPLVEEIGLITDLGNWAIREASRQGSLWQKQGMDIFVSVNVTVQQLLAPDFLAVVRGALSEWGFPANRLVIELTESTLLHASGSVIELLAELGASGIRIAIDDFGTGYSSFAYLHQFPLDELKVDKSFIDSIETRPDTRSIVAAMVDMGHHLGLTVLAEGVEHEGQLQILRDLGCDQFQGFLSSPAVSPKKLEALASDS